MRRRTVADQNFFNRMRETIADMPELTHATSEPYADLLHELLLVAPAHNAVASEDDKVVLETAWGAADRYVELRVSLRQLGQGILGRIVDQEVTKDTFAISADKSMKIEEPDVAYLLYGLDHIPEEMSALLARRVIPALANWAFDDPKVQDMIVIYGLNSEGAEVLSEYLKQLYPKGIPTRSLDEAA